VEQRVGAGQPARPVARGERERQCDILAQRQIGQDVERLKDEADAVAAETGEACLVERAQIDALDRDAA
jgi:hypothetical protein